MNLQIETDEAVFGLDSSGDANDIHFYIDCACKGKNGQYSGCTVNRNISGSYRPSDKKARLKHTFYQNADALSLGLFIDKELGNDSFIIVCNDCNRHFEMNGQKISGLKRKIWATQVHPPTQ